MDEMMIRLRRGDRDPWIGGVAAGFAGLAISFGLRGLSLARPLGDPLPLILSVTQLTRGFTYFPWRPLIAHLIFAISLGILSSVMLWIIARNDAGPDQAAKAGRIASGINLIVVAALAVDAPIVGFWYLIAGAASLIITGVSARYTAVLFKRMKVER